VKTLGQTIITIFNRNEKSMVKILNSIYTTGGGLIGEHALSGLKKNRYNH